MRFSVHTTITVPISAVLEVEAADAKEAVEKAKSDICENHRPLDYDGNSIEIMRETDIVIDAVEDDKGEQVNF